MLATSETTITLLLLGALAVLSLRLRVAGTCSGIVASSAALGTAQHALLNPDVDQRTHGLEILLAEQRVQASDVDEVDEAGVELPPCAQVPELEPVAVVDVCVAAQHLAVDVADLGRERGREVAALAQPGRVGVARWRLLVDGRQVAAEGLGGEQSCIGDLTSDPFLNVRDVLVGGHAHALLVVVQPGVGCAWAV